MFDSALLHYIDTGDVDLQQLDLSDTPSLSFDSSGDTHKGWIRSLNEDAYLELPQQKLWAVADGMGGHKRGDFASNAIIKALDGFSRANDTNPSLDSIIENIQHRLVDANDACQQAFRAKRVGSTIALLFEYGGYCFYLWAGDSRIYRLRNGKIEQMTHDHSLAQEKYDKGELDQTQAADHSSAQILTRAVGIHRHLKLELRCTPAESGDRYLLCSDGLHGSVDTPTLLSLLAHQDRQATTEHLIQSALDAGGRDNITAIVIDAV